MKMCQYLLDHACAARQSLRCWRGPAPWAQRTLWVSLWRHHRILR